MEIIQRLKLSVAQSFESCLDSVCTDLRADISAYEARVKDAEQRAQVAEQTHERAVFELDALRQENADLQEEKRHQETILRESDNAIERELQLNEVYEPQRVFCKSFSKMNAADFKKVHDSYFELHGQARVLIQASSELKKRVKLYRKKVAFLQARPERQASLPSPNADLLGLPRVEAMGAPPVAINPLRAPVGDLETNVFDEGQAAPTSEMLQQQDGSSSSIVGEMEDETEDGQREEQSVLSPMAPDSSTDSSDLPPNATVAPIAHSGSLKRKRAVSKKMISTAHSSTRSPSRGSPAHPTMVKSETLSSSPLQSHPAYTGPPGTQDLDDVGDTVATPTKRVRYRDYQHFQASPGNTAKNIRLQPTKDTIHQGIAAGDTKSDRNSSRVLQPIDSNLRISGGNGQTPNKGQIRKSGGISRISSIAEDGDENGSLACANRETIQTPHSHQKVRNPLSGHRLSDLLEGTSSTSQMLRTRVRGHAHAPTQSRTSYSPASCTYKANRVETDATTTAAAIPSALSRSAPKESPRSNSPEAVVHGTDHMESMKAAPDDEPYRARPLERLGLGHFKINPAYNHGLDYAYDEVIRKKDERKCVSGCTRPGCCGEKFTAMARFGIPMGASGRAISDNDILEMYLGANKSVSDMLSSEDRENLLVEAKAKVFADRFGKHRHQHHRSGTPPGFWRTDMPGTQELEHDRKEAQALEREKVKERYREAMSSGGRWMFADE